MQNNLTYSSFLKDFKTQIDNIKERSMIISICDQIPNFELLSIYDNLQKQYSFSAMWEEKDNVSFIALDKCKSITLDGSARFNKAKNFHYENFKNLIDISGKYNYASLPKIIYFFSFTDNTDESLDARSVPNMEAVLPKIIIIKDSEKAWIRVNIELNYKKSIRNLFDEFTSIRNTFISPEFHKDKENINMHISKFDNAFNHSKKYLIRNINKAIQLIEEGQIDKVVLSSRINFKLENKFKLNIILKKLKNSQHNSCIYVWNRNSQDITFGASPEKLFSIKNNKLTLEAIAGTSSSQLNKDLLLNNEKNMREHQFVVNYLISSLKKLGINNFQKNDLKVKNFGNVLHLYTLIYSSISEVCPFELLKILHPSPAVCGFPQKRAMQFINTLETFSRGNYASPIGWVDNQGNSDFRVAIRGARYINEEIQFTAGAGIVKDSKCLEEVEEIKLKFESIANQIFLSKVV